MTDDVQSITHQAAGAFGEKAVEAELLRHGWIPANINQTVKNAAKFDIYAMNGVRSVQIRVKTCRPSGTAFVFGGFLANNPIDLKDIESTDFTIFVRMGIHRQSDRFYVVPTTIVRSEIAKRQSEHKQSGKKDIGMWRLSFASRRDGQEQGGTGIEMKWRQYEDAWDLLVGQSPADR